MDDPTELLDSKAELDQEEIERLLRENRALKSRLEELERENRLLKQRNFDLSMRYGRTAENRRHPFELVFADNSNEDTNEESEVKSTSGSDNNETGKDDTREHSDASLIDSKVVAAGAEKRVRRFDSGDVQDRERNNSIDGGNNKEKKIREHEERHGVRRKEARHLKCYGELDGHEGAIYSVQYSSTGEFLASASFDKTVRIWDIAGQKSVSVFSGHQQSVFDVAWSEDSSTLVSGSFDRSCIEWDIETQKPAVHLPCSGLVQCVRYSTHSNNLIYSGDSSGFITIHDTRATDGKATQLSNDNAMVNTMYCFYDETRLVSGDRNGEIKIWDVRMGRFMRLIHTNSQQHAISHISVARNEQSGTEYMAVTSYDNAIRVYDRVDDSSVPTPRVIHEIRGLRTRNWPIKNAIFDPNVSKDKLSLVNDDEYFEIDTRSQNEARGLRSMLFLLTGSADPLAYLYGLSTHLGVSQMDDRRRRPIRQRLEGHSDRVYGVATHPSEIKACTAGADNTIKLWHIPSSGRLLKDRF